VAAADNFVRFRLLLDLDASPDDIFVTNHQENSEQHKRKRHAELDNIDAVASWRQPLAQKPDSDMFSHKLRPWAIATASQCGSLPTWQKFANPPILTKKEFARRAMEIHTVATREASTQHIARND
jgi:hypothetical protein